jgi:hypothetical protein
LDLRMGDQPSSVERFGIDHVASDIDHR